MDIKNNDNLDVIKKYIKLNENTELENKKQNGEVFTPFEIIENMLQKIEITYSNEYNANIFENENLKWYDNSSGVGNIIIVIYYKLMNGLKQIKNKEKRKKHILTKMLYMSELNEKNCNICKKFLDPNNKYKININNGNSLELNIFEKWKIEYMDIIIGNPPYQKVNKKNNSSRGGTQNNLYIEFIEKSLKTLKNDGYLIYIHPQNWRKINSKIFNLYLDNNLLHVSLNYGGKLFKNVSVKTDYYILKKNNIVKKSTKIECYDNKNKLIMNSNLIIHGINFIPNIFSEDIQNILIKINKKGESRKCIINSDCHKITKHVNLKSDIFIYPLYNTSGNPFKYFSSKPHKDQYIKKVLMSNSGKLKPFYDKGDYGTTQDAMYFVVNNEIEGLNMVKILNSILYKFLMKICQWSNFRNESSLLSYLKYPPLKNEINENLINIFFGLNENEIKIIDTM
jgi:adenine-specific DNA-methyltransferase